MAKAHTLVIISGPVASGKSTVVTALLQRHPNWAEVQSYTTRQPRPNEVVRNKYLFVTKDDFRARVAAQDIVEYEEYAGNLYGTSRASLERTLKTATVVILDAQTKGKETLQRLYPEAIDIYLYVTGAEIKERLATDASRQQTDLHQQELRLKQAIAQNAGRFKYGHVVANRADRLPAVIDEVEQIILNQVAAHQL